MTIIYILILLFIILITISYIKIDINRIEITDKKIDKDFKILQLSDLHNRNIKKRLEKILNKEKPDIIILSGDMINERLKETKNFMDIIPLLEQYDTYYTFGNHEEELSEKEYRIYSEIINDTKLKILNNKGINISNNIYLYGLNIDVKYFLRFKNIKLQSKEIKDYLENLNNKNYNILIAHNPLFGELYSDYNVDLTLSGHVHGGLIRGLLSPEFKLFPKYYQNTYDIKNMKMIVSRGLGFSKKIPFRLFNPGEIIIINLKK